jgi:Ca2+-binding RTX toxin-like protein
MHRQQVDDVGPVVASPVAVAEQVRGDRVVVRPGPGSGRGASRVGSPLPRSSWRGYKGCRRAEGTLSDRGVRMQVRRLLAIIASSSLIFGIAFIAAPASAGTRGCTIRGTDHHDRLIGTPGSDVICGFGGNDFLRGRGGVDVFHGGDGADVLLGGDGPDVMFGGLGRDQLYPEGDDDTARGGRGADDIGGGPGDDRLNGGPGRDFLGDIQGIDLLRGEAGGDCLFTDDGQVADAILGGPGVDRWEADSGDTVIDGEVEDPLHCD